LRTADTVLWQCKRHNSWPSCEGIWLGSTSSCDVLGWSVWTAACTTTGDYTNSWPTTSTI